MSNKRYDLPAVFILLVVMTLAMGASVMKDWILIGSDGFKIEFPMNPDVESRVLETEIGTLDMEIIMYDASEDEDDENFVYGLIYTNYPDEYIDAIGEEHLNEFFDLAIDGSVQRTAGKLLTKENIKLGEYPGREIMVDFQEGIAVINMRFYLVDTRMYVLQAISEAGNEKNRSAVRFMDSFRLTK